LDQILTSTLGEAEALYRQIYEHRAPMMRFLTNLQIPLPKAFYTAAEFVLNGYLRRALEQEEIDADRVKTLLETAKLEGVALDHATLEFAYRHNLERMMEQFTANPVVNLAQQVDRAASLIHVLPFRVDLWKIQNAYYFLLQNSHPSMHRQKDRGDRIARAWVECFEALGKKLAVKVT
jgi:hypothetical protein